MPAQGQQADIARGDLFDATTQAQAGVQGAYADLYGNAGDMGNAGGARLQANQSRRARLQRELQNPQSVEIRERLQQQLAGLDADDLRVRAGVATGQAGTRGL